MGKQRLKAGRDAAGRSDRLHLGRRVQPRPEQNSGRLAETRRRARGLLQDQSPQIPSTSSSVCGPTGRRATASTAGETGRLSLQPASSASKRAIPPSASRAGVTRRSGGQGRREGIGRSGPERREGPLSVSRATAFGLEAGVGGDRACRGFPPPQAGGWGRTSSVQAEPAAAQQGRELRAALPGLRWRFTSGHGRGLDPFIIAATTPLLPPRRTAAPRPKHRGHPLLAWGLAIQPPAARVRLRVERKHQASGSGPAQSEGVGVARSQAGTPATNCCGAQRAGGSSRSRPGHVLAGGGSEPVVALPPGMGRPQPVEPLAQRQAAPPTRAPPRAGHSRAFRARAAVPRHAHAPIPRADSTSPEHLQGDVF